MGKVRDAIKAKLNELQQRKNEPAPNYAADPGYRNHVKSRLTAD